MRGGVSLLRKLVLLMNRIIYIVLATAMLLLASCKHSEGKHRNGDIEILRFDKVLFETPANKLQSTLQQEATKFNCSILPVRVNDPNYMAQVAGFTQDGLVREIYDTVAKYYSDLTWLERELTPAMQRLQKAYGKSTEVSLECKKAIALITAQFDYEYRVAVSDGNMLIAIDQYTLPYMEKYGYFNIPMYLVMLSNKDFLLTDCISALAQQVVPIGEMNQMLDYMIAAGKTLYMLDIACPKMDDRLKIRYTEEQMDWMKHNEGNVWAYFVQNKMLFETDINKFHNFIDEAPKTNAFRDSAPRTAEYIGWQIVRQYAKKTGASLQEVLNETNSNKMMQQSGYRPR